MKIWVDADACPGAIKAIIIKAANTRHIETLFVANKPIYLPASSYLAAVQVMQGADAADQYIVQHTLKDDLVITQDIPLASQLVAKGVAALSPHGVLFDANNIGERLSIRNFMQEIRDLGGRTKGPRPFDQKDKQKFAQRFDQLLSQAGVLSG